MSGPAFHGEEDRTSWSDSHCHLQDCEDLEATIRRGHAMGVHRAICVGTDLRTSELALELARKASALNFPTWSTVGLHPHDATDDIEDIAELAEKAFIGKSIADNHPGSAVAIGECGLDYYYEHSPRGAQRAAFARQIDLAKLHDATLVVHTRDAWDDTIAVLRSEGAPERTVIHCFSGGVEDARRCLDLGAYLSFSGIVTFKNAQEVRDAAQTCPLDRLLVETDAPYLAPTPHRGQPNEPGYVALVGESAQLRNISARVLGERTTQNMISAFALSM